MIVYIFQKSINNIKELIMIKKVIAGTILSAMTLFALPNDELKLAGISQAAQKKLVVLTNMKLKGDEKEKFGKLYDEYQEVLMRQDQDLRQGS